MTAVHVATADQARLLLTVELRPLLDSLIRRPASITELAGELGLDVQRAYYLVQKLLKAGIAEVRHVARGKRHVKVYTVSQPWFIPYEVAASEALEAFVNAQVQPRIERLVGDILQVYIGQTGEQRGFWLSGEGLSLGDTTGPTQQLWEGEEDLLFTLGQIRLSRERVIAFKRSLVALVEAEEGTSVDTRLYSFTVMVAPKRIK